MDSLLIQNAYVNGRRVDFINVPSLHQWNN